MDAGAAGWFEPRRDLLRGLERSCAECIFDDAELIGKSRRPRLLASRGGRGFDGYEATECLLYRRSIGCLEFWPKPADQAGCFFGSALGVECNNVCENLFSAEVRSPTVCGKDGLIKLVMNLAEDSNEAHLVGGMIFNCQFFVSPELFEDVVHLRECESGVKLLLASAVGIKALSAFANQ